VTRARGAALPRVVAVFALAAVAPLFFSPSGDILNNMVLAAAYVVMALGLNTIVGFAGLIDLGYVAFFAIGAYTAAYFGSGFWANAGSDRRGIAVLVGDSVAGTPGIHVNFLLILALAVATTAVAGTLIGVPTLRLRGDYIAIVTLAFGGISRAFLASYLGVVNAAQFEFSFSIFIFAMVVLGGLGSIPGVVAGAIILSVVNHYLLPDVLFDLPGKVGLAFDLSAISSGIYGAILVVVMVLRPQGLVPARVELSARS